MEALSRLSREKNDSVGNAKIIDLSDIRRRKQQDNVVHQILDAYRANIRLAFQEYQDDVHRGIDDFIGEVKALTNG